MSERCTFNRCTGLVTVVYLKHPLCDRHFSLDGHELRKRLGLPLYLTDRDRKQLVGLCWKAGVRPKRNWSQSDLVKALLGVR